MHQPIRIDDTRPYAEVTAHMTTQKWKDIWPERVCLWDLTLSQETVSIRGLLGSAWGEPTHTGDPFIHVVEWRGVEYLEDGHHQWTREILAGRDHALARVFRTEATN